MQNIEIQLELFELNIQTKPTDRHTEILSLTVKLSESHNS